MYNIICNPVAGKGKTLRLLKTLENFLQSKNLDYTIYKSDNIGHATELCNTLTKEGCNLVCMGGDGTLHEILNGIDNIDEVTLGILPCGTGNDFAKSLGLPVDDVVAAFEIILKGVAKPVDFIKMNDRRVMNVTGMGIDVDVLERTRKAKIIKGKAQYYLSLFRSLLTFKWNKYSVKIDGGQEEFHSAMITAVCNGKYFGGGMMISPKSKVNDGKLDVVIINKMPRYKIPLALIGFFTGKLLQNKYVNHYVCEEAEFITDAKPVINADGELVYGQNFKCSIQKNLLKIFLPETLPAL